MGTNYYQRTKAPGCFERYEERHIGKKSHGWSFSFRGYWKEDGESIPYSLNSWESWKSYLQTTGGIFNEYGEEVPFEDFVAMIEDWGSPDYIHLDGRKNLVHNIEIRKDDERYMQYRSLYEEYHDPKRTWEDEKGYSFQTNEFS